MCLFRSLDREKDLTQTLQEKGFSPVWVLSCDFKLVEREKVVLQTEQATYFSPECESWGGLELGKLSDRLDSCDPWSTVVWEVLAGRWGKVVDFEYINKDIGPNEWCNILNITLIKSKQSRVIIHSSVFHWLGPLGRVSYRVAMSMCLCVPSQNTHFRVSWRPVVKEPIPNIGLWWPN